MENIDLDKEIFLITSKLQSLTEEYQKLEQTKLMLVNELLKTQGALDVLKLLKAKDKVHPSSTIGQGTE